jgi:hypothetical protein
MSRSVEFVYTYTCNLCGEILDNDLEEARRHLVSEHDPEWRGSYEEVADEMQRNVRRKPLTSHQE